MRSEIFPVSTGQPSPGAESSRNAVDDRELFEKPLFDGGQEGLERRMRGKLFCLRGAGQNERCEGMGIQQYMSV